MDTAAVSPPVLPDYIWHHRVHTEMGERLFYWRLSFSPVYLRDSVLAGLKAALARCGVKSVAAYEMFGAYDVLVRVWLPEDCDPSTFQNALLEELKPHGLEMCEPFSVEYQVRHWAFAKKKKADEPPIQAIKELIRDPDTIQKLEAGTLGFKETKKLTGNRLVAVPDECDPNLPGIKFALIVSGESLGVNDAEHGLPPVESSGNTLLPDDRRTLEELVTKVVIDAKSISERSLYAGSGFGHFVILGRVAYKNFHDIHAELVTQFGIAPLRERFNVSTTTMVSGQRGLRLFSESLLESPFVVHTPASAISSEAFASLEGLSAGTYIAERFEIVASLGNGAFGAVYKVRDHREGKVARALKLFPAGGGDAAQREVSMLRRVQSPYVVSMYWGDRDPATGWWYLVSELVEGEELEDYVRGSKAGELSETGAIEVVRQILLGLEALHPQQDKLGELERINQERDLTEREWAAFQELKDKAIVHRDIKPANVMITPTGVVKLIDFNIASLAGDLRETNSRTPRYSPPHGWPDHAWTPKVDLFATGIILYELLSGGKHPYSNGNGEMSDPRNDIPNLSDAQCALLVKACSVDDCFETSGTMRLALESAWSPV